MFKQYVEDCKCVEEATSYLEIFNYSVSSYFISFLTDNLFHLNYYWRCGDSSGLPALPSLVLLG